MESDVYAYGVVFWELITHNEPYKGLSDLQIMRKVCSNEVHVQNNESNCADIWF